MFRLLSISDLNADMDILVTQMTERALSTFPSEEPGAVSAKNHFRSLVKMMTMRPLMPSLATSVTDTALGESDHA